MVGKFQYDLKVLKYCYLILFWHFSGISLHKTIRVKDEYGHIVAILSPEVLIPKSDRLIAVEVNDFNEFFVKLKNPPKSAEEHIEMPPDLDDPTLEYYNNLDPDNNADFTFKPHTYPKSRYFSFHYQIDYL